MRSLVITILCLASVVYNHAQEVTFEDLTHASQQLMKSENPEAVLRGSIALLSKENRPIGHIFQFSPSGFIITSANKAISPLYAYSFMNDFNLSKEDRIKAKAIFTQDLKNRIQLADQLSPVQERAIAQEWEHFLAGDLLFSPAQQWPPEGSTPSGGWIITDWTQSDPYNLMCPMDLNAGARSIAGCPAIAIGQVLNYHETLNGTTFNDGDDYYHSYGSGNQYWIDDDHDTRGFPSFDSLNFWLSSMEYAYQIQAPISFEMKAALCFACGVAAHQVYTASVSGTFGIDQAWESFQRFGFVESTMIFPDDTTLNSQIADNIKVALPVQLGLLVEPPGSGGHNVVVDGYNTDEFYHFNFGWGGSANGWYTLPPTNIPYNLTIIEGAILDIKSPNYTGTSKDPASSSYIQIYPNPASNHIVVKTVIETALITIYDLTGKPVLAVSHNGSTSKIEVNHLAAGIYIILVDNKGDSVYQGKIIIQ